MVFTIPKRKVPRIFLGLFNTALFVVLVYILINCRSDCKDYTSDDSKGQNSDC
jgi:hypothetical protein